MIEDHEDTRFVLATVLEQEGFEVFEAADGAEGLREFEACGPDLVVTDLMMPEMDGLEVAHALAASGGAVPVILASAHADTPKDRDPVLAGSFNAILRKPVVPSDLISTVRALLGSK